MLEHINDEGDSSAFAKHCINLGHDITASKMSVLHHVTKGRLLNRLEEVETFRALHRNNQALLNDMSEVLILSFTAFVFGNR